MPEGEAQPKVLLMIGNAGSSLWPAFTGARENQPGLELDQWTRHVVGKIAADVGGRALFPFEGPPFWPFTQWALRTGALFPSPLGLTVHPVFGLWHAFRAALMLDHDPGFPNDALDNPCASCADRPCLHSCPVQAFSGQGYDFDACLGYLSSGANPCRSEGCDARKACPVGQVYRYAPDHAAFHMTQLLKARGRV